MTAPTLMQRVSLIDTSTGRTIATADVSEVRSFEVIADLPPDAEMSGYEHRIWQLLHMAELAAVVRADPAAGERLTTALAARWLGYDEDVA